jgi:hypothetical protein
MFVVDVVEVRTGCGWSSRDFLLVIEARIQVRGQTPAVS